MKYIVAGPCFNITVKFVSRKTLHKHAKNKPGEKTNGLYDDVKNLIYIANDLSEDETLHVLCHELIHACEYQVSGQEEEARVDSMASWLVKIAQFTVWQQVVMNA